MNETMSMTISLSRKVNLGNYETAEVFVSLNGVTADTTAKEMDALLEGQGAIAYEKLVEAIRDKTPKARAAAAKGDEKPAPKAEDDDPFADDVPLCKECKGEMWDNRENKKNPKGPDYKCKDRECGAGAWINKDGSLYWKKG